jgi:PAS domain S-box-containing protein
VTEPVRRRAARGDPARTSAGSDPERVRLDLIMTAAQVGTFDWDITEDVLVWDERIFRLFGLDPAGFDGRIATFWATLLPEDVRGTEEAVARAIETCGRYAAEYRIRLPDGSVRWIEAYGHVLPGEDGRPRRMLGVARDSTEVRGARDTVARALEHMADAFVAVDAGWRVSYLNRNAEALLGNLGQGDIRGQLLWEAWPELTARGLDQVFRAAVRTREPQVATTFVAATERWWQLRVVPAEDGVGGASVFGTDVTAVRAAELAQARELGRPEQARRVLAYTAALAEADSLADVVDTVATMVLPAYGAAGMLVSLAESGRLRLAGHYGYEERAVELLAVLALDGDTPISQVLRTSKPLFLPSREAYLGLFPHLLETVEASAKHAWAFLPLNVPGRTLGSLTISFAERHDFPTDEQSLLVGLSGLIAQTLARARLRESERTLTAELQAQLLPRELPEPAGIEARARYLTATDGMGVGGDWYDLLELPAGRVGLVIGDVQGHNMQAAAVMGQLRNALRAYAAEGHEPAAVLSRTNRMMRDLDPGLFATCCYVAVEVGTGLATVALAGHPPPMRRAHDGTVTSLEGPVGAPLGVAPDAEYATRDWHLDPGDLLLLFTDGLVEDSGQSLDVGLGALAALLSTAQVDDLDALADHVMAASLPDDRLSDDVAVLLARHDGVPGTVAPVTARFSVDRGDPRAARHARDAIGRFVSDPGLRELRETCVLLVSEVVTNALRHTDGQVWLELWRYRDRLRVEVSDETSRGLVTGGHDLLDEAGRGVPLMDALSDAWGTAPRGEGKVVWFELALPTVPAGD